ncbi:Protein ccsmst1 [Liparis tanakae]|uniref:Protein ccsmst1 n=1 Tax=Liparis tanakae TaxID=230148 RepID=A0A4Z2FG06_9TELE|nr:Protein ccsmst1 [Liparis tanakae]
METHGDTKRHMETQRDTWRDKRHMERQETHGETRHTVNSVRCLALSAQDKSREDKVSDEPIKFSTSKASHRTWRVERSLGSQFERPWWKVLPLSLFFGGLILWCALREQTHIDELLQKQLYEHLPGLLPATEDEEPDPPAETEEEQPDSPAEDDAHAK